MKKPKILIRAFSLITLVFMLALQAFLPLASVSAAQITDRSLTLIAGATDGGSKPGGVVNHRFTFTAPGTTNIGSIKLEYCTTASGTCTMPTGLVTTSATLNSQSGGNTGFTLNNTTNGAPYLTRTAAAGAGTTSTYQINTVTNPSTEGTFFVRVTTYSSIDVTTGATDLGSVAASTNEQIIIDGTMPESLVFCTGATVGLTAGVPDCATATAGTISFDQLFSPTDTAKTSSQMAASTNAGAGYIITVNGPTLTSGSNTIAGMNTSGLGVRGTAQFGLNLKANTTLTTTVAIGTEVAPAANAANYRGQSASGYDTIDNFKFTTGDTVANSFNGSPGGTDAQIFTVSYIVNVPGSQPAGTYTSTLTYICTPTF